MLLTYLDESYTKDHYYIAALACPDCEAVSLRSALDRIVHDAASSYATSPTAELHGHALFQGRDDWAALPSSMVRARIGIYDKAMSAIGAHDVDIFICGVDIARLRNRYPSPESPHAICLQHIMERIDKHARRHGERVLLIADEVAGEDEHRQRLWTYQRDGTPGYMSSKLDQIVDTIYFAPSRASRLLQSADLIAFLYRRMQTHLEPDARATRANELLWSRVRPRVRQTRTWLP